MAFLKRKLFLSAGAEKDRACVGACLEKLVEFYKLMTAQKKKITSAKKLVPFCAEMSYNALKKKPLNCKNL